MSVPHPLRRLHPFEGLCLTAQDLADEQRYHRESMARQALFLHGHGVVQGLQVTLEQREQQHVAIVNAGFGIAASGQGVHLPEDVAVPLEIPKQDGEYVLWLFHVERPDPESQRPVYDTGDQRHARVLEEVAPRLLPATDEPSAAVALARLNVRLGRLVQVQLPVPRAGRRVRAAESYLKPRVLDFVRLSRRVVNDLFRTATLKEQSVGLLTFLSALVSAEFLMVEEGTPDRVLYRTAGTLISYAHDFYDPLPPTIERIEQFTEFVRRVHAEIPGPDQGDDTWLRWFLQFERLLQPLQRVQEELQKTVEAMR